LEAVFLLSQGTSFQSYPEINLINADVDTEFTKLQGVVDENELEVIISRFKDGTVKKLKINGQNKRNGNFSQVLHSIIFSPNSISLVDGAPEIRRKDLDDFLSSVDKKYYSSLSKYKKVVRNRNKILERLNKQFGSLEELEFWNDKLINLGAEIVGKRLALLGSIHDNITKISKLLLNYGKVNLEISYDSRVDYADDVAEDLRKKVFDNLDKEISAEHTLYGPHRDDISFILNGKDLRTLGSRAQQRLSALVYKLALWKTFEKDKNTSTILLLDDIMSELDSEHKAKVEKFLLSHKSTQMIITSSDEKVFSNKFLDKVRSIPLKG
jgi:DNA replication and repair protein RecF